jgi:Zn ribbon nucleic-acid-binding protein
MLGGMETPEHERRAVEEYLRSQSGTDFEIEHVEKLTSEYVHGHQYDVWDAHTNEGRWWVITPPTNLYSQQHIKSMDIALSFHIGLMSRMMARESRHANSKDNWVLEVLRRIDVAGDSLDRAKEVEDFQAVGMRLREALLTLAVKLGYQSSQGAEALQAANFKGWANIAAESVAAGGSAKELRSLLKGLSEKAWNYVRWLTHARNAGEPDARIALSVVSQTIEAFIVAVTRQRLGAPERCPVCASYQLALQRTENGDWVKRCATCGWTSPAVDLPPVRYHDPAKDEAKQAPEGDCVEVEDFGIYLSPSQARSILEDVRSQRDTDTDQPSWVNPFAFLFVEDGSVVDAHRLAFMSFEHPPAPGSELVYPCNEVSCVNPSHATELPLSSESGWIAGIVEKVIPHASHLELQVGIADSGTQRVFVNREILDRYGFGDASSLVERAVFLAAADDRGWVWLVPAVRRVDHSQGSAAAGWLHPPDHVDGDDPCPCGAPETYSACHGERASR